MSSGEAGSQLLARRHDYHHAVIPAQHYAVIPAQHYAVIPAKAGIHFDLALIVRGSLLKHIRVFFRPPSWRPGHFSLLAQREVTKRKGTAVALAGLLPGD